MIESPRRHGHFDERWNTSPSRSRVPEHAAGHGDRSIERWENEGGRSKTDGIDAPSGLEWYSFSGRYFADRRRHDLEALTAYEAYRPARRQM